MLKHASTAASGARLHVWDDAEADACVPFVGLMPVCVLKSHSPADVEGCAQLTRFSS
jgi:hypothetical protein